MRERNPMIMRKDVRIGLAIGGVLVAVLIVYLLITAAAPRNNEVTLAPDEPALQQPAPGGIAEPARPPATAPAEGTAPRSNTPEHATPKQNDPWQKALSTGQLDSADSAPPMMLTVTPTPTTQPTVNAAPPDTSIQPPTAHAPDGLAIAATPSTQPSTGQRTHVVQQGETYSSIAAAAYGDAAYYPHLKRANPTIDEKKLRPGMTIVIPDKSQVVAISTGATPQLASDSKPATSVDSSREYRVQPRDSLYKISLKLYGRADKADAIYQLNKDAIGPNPSVLKVGLVLKLPDPPSSTAAAR
jgi:nucleoid-associated protein YgaU